MNGTGSMKTDWKFIILCNFSLVSLYFLIKFSILVCATYPITILAIATVVCGAFSAGIIRLEVTTDPIELWAAPDSRARVEKDYFDKNLGPFYRTEQLIITPTNDKQVKANTLLSISTTPLEKRKLTK